MTRRSKRKARALTYRSGLEDKIAEQLRDAGMGFTYESHTFDVVTPLGKNRVECGECGSSNLRQHRRYTPDFFLDNGVVIETKGRFLADNRRLVECFVKQHPEVDYRMVFSNDRTLSKGAKTKYSDWCESRGIPYAIGEIPESWLKKSE